MVLRSQFRVHHPNCLALEVIINDAYQNTHEPYLSRYSSMFRKKYLCIHEYICMSRVKNSCSQSTNLALVLWDMKTLTLCSTCLEYYAPFIILLYSTVSITEIEQNKSLIINSLSPKLWVPRELFYEFFFLILTFFTCKDSNFLYFQLHGDMAKRKMRLFSLQLYLKIYIFSLSLSPLLIISVVLGFLLNNRHQLSFFITINSDKFDFL